MQHVKIIFGNDAHGFYWPGSEQKRREVMAVKRGQPNIFEATYQNRPGAREGSIFLESDFVEYAPPIQLNIGIKHLLVKQFCEKGYAILNSWDTAFTKTKQSAYTVCVTALLVPCDKYHRDEDPEIFGPCEFHFDVLVLDVLREKLDWGGLVKAFKQQHYKWNPLVNIIELRASGLSLFSALESSGLPIEGVKTEEGKRARAIAGTEAGSTQGWFRQHRVLIPTEGAWAPWRPAYKTEMKDFSGEDDAVSDQTDATVHLVNHAIKLGSSSAKLPTDWSPERSVSEIAAMARSDLLPGHPLHDSRADFLMYLGEAPNMSVDVFEGTCGRCAEYDRGYCKVFKIQKPSLDGCQAWTPIVVPAAH